MSSAAVKSRESLGDRMKANYEDRQRVYLTRRTPVIIRLDGKAFHTFTRGLERPFSKVLNDCMRIAAWHVAEEAQGFKLSYVQSDEVSLLLTDWDRLETSAWFDYNKSKVESVAASCMTAWFNKAFGGVHPAMFDARAFNIPKEEVANYFLWRAKDWERNSVSMYCRSFFSHSQMHGTGKADQHEMLHSIGKNWTTDLDPLWRNGTWLTAASGGSLSSVRHDVQPRWDEINAFVAPLLEPKKEDEDEPGQVGGRDGRLHGSVEEPAGGD